jgi:hypothetical protein
MRVEVLSFHGRHRGTSVESEEGMNALFGDSNSFLGGDDDEDLPLIVGNEAVTEESAVIVLVCHSCEKPYGLPGEIDDVRLLEMCPRCAHVFADRPVGGDSLGADALASAMNR